MEILTAQRLFCGTGFLTGHGVLVANGMVNALVKPGQAPEGARVRDYGAAILAPGFLDVQVNGGDGVLVNADPTPESLARMVRAHARCGTTGLLATVISDRPAVRRQAFEAVRTALERGLTGLLGIHFEGPFLNPNRRGVHEARWLGPPTNADLALMTTPSGGVTLVTLAPECVPADRLACLVQAGVRVAAGHTAADAEDLARAVSAGVTGFTHLFNATGPLSARVPGPAGIALDLPGVTCGVIADGHHVDPIMIRIAWRQKGADGLMLVSDAMPPAAGGPSHFQLGDAEIQARNGRCTAPDGGLAGSRATLADCVRFCVEVVGLPLGDVLTMATATPARFLGVADRFGHLAPGRAADLVVLDDRGRVLKTWKDGVPVPTEDSS